MDSDAVDYWCVQRRKLTNISITPSKTSPKTKNYGSVRPAEPVMAFDLREPLLKEVQEVVWKARSRSAPGPSGTSYKVYKHCPKLLNWLWKILKVIWRKGIIVQQWWLAGGVWIPKEESSKNISQFRIISLLSIEGKIFFSIAA